MNKTFVIAGGHVNRKLVAILVTLFMLLSSTAIGLAQQKKFLFATGPVAGLNYPLGAAIASVWNKKIPDVNVTVQSTGASIENARLLGKGETEVALVQVDIAHYAYNGLGVFKEKNEKYTNYSAICGTNVDPLQILVHRDSPIKSIYDLKGKTIALGAPGSGTENSARQVFGIYGLDYKAKQDIIPRYYNMSESAQHFKDKTVDGAFFQSAAPNSAIMDMISVRPVRFLDIDDEMSKKLIESFQFFQRWEVPANTYSGQTTPIKTVAMVNVLAVRNDVSNDIVYKFTKTVFEEKAAIALGHSSAKYLDLSTATKGITIPVHPGAQKYFKEKGVLK